LDGDVRCPVTIRMLPAPPVVAARVSGATSVLTGVDALSVLDGVVYAGGWFTNIGGQIRNKFLVFVITE
jgi:hypothetical protein